MDTKGAPALDAALGIMDLAARCNVLVVRAMCAVGMEVATMASLEMERVCAIVILFMVSGMVTHAQLVSAGTMASDAKTNASVLNSAHVPMEDSGQVYASATQATLEKPALCVIHLSSRAARMPLRALDQSSSLAMGMAHARGFRTPC